ncbi:glycosyltransferase [Azospirillum argentinense]
MIEAAGDVAGLIDRRRYRAALAALDAMPGKEDLSRRRLRRQCLARMGLFAEAAAVGHAVMADPAATPDDIFRQAQILIECGRWGEAAEAAATGLAGSPGEVRFVVPLAQAALADRRLEPLVTRACSGSGSSSAGRVPERAPAVGRLFAPQRLPFYSTLDAAHPGSVGMLSNLGAGWDVWMPTALPADWPAAVAPLLRLAAPLVDRLTTLSPLVDRAAAARYVGQRVLTLLADDGGAVLDFLPNAPMTLGQRHWVLWYDVLPVLFQPFLPFDAMCVNPRLCPYHAIIGAFLASDRCAAIITHYRLDDNPLLRLFPDRRIAAKLAFVNPLETDAPSGGRADGSAACPAPGRPFRLLFTSSWNARDDDFFYRGGIDVVTAFLTLAQEFEDVELVLRSPLPATLSPALRQAITGHPRIIWRPDRLPAGEFQDLVAGSDLFVMPMGVLYRNGLVQAMKAGIVPVVANAMGVDDLVTDGVTGCVIPGRGGFYTVGGEDGILRQDFHPLLQATDAPADPAFHAALVERLRMLLRDRPQVSRMGNAARSEAHRRWSHAEHTARFAEVMTGAMDKAVRAAASSRGDKMADSADRWLQIST